MVVEKNPAPMIRGIALLRERVPGARLVMVGDGPRRGELELLARELGVADAVEFTGAIYEEERLAPWMLSAALMCYPFSAGLSLLHAFGYGLPVVVGDREGSHNPEIEALEPGRSGVTYAVSGGSEDAPESVGAMVGAWERLMGDEGLRRRLGERARELVETRYTIENMARGFVGAFAAADGVERELVIPEGWERGG
jgi:glycosyltransferase involved in cell wall biosynthesis